MNIETLDGLAACPLFEGISREEIKMHTILLKCSKHPTRGEFLAQRCHYLI
jgi:hypothetical protein